MLLPPLRSASLMAVSLGLALTSVSCSSSDDDDGGGIPAGVNSFTAGLDRAQEVTPSILGTGVRVTVRNQAPDDGTFQTPVWIGFHDGTFDLYNLNEDATAELERLAEDGNAGPLSDAFATSAAGSIDGTIDGLFGAAVGPISPGESVSRSFRLDPAAASSRYLSYASMVIPSNDAFIANGGPLDHEVYDDLGAFQDLSFTVTGAEVLDAGTEINSESATDTAFLGQSTANTGTNENAMVQLHGGFIPGGDILLAYPGGDFTQVGYEALTVSLTEDMGPFAEPTGLATISLNPGGPSISYEITASNLSGVATGFHLHTGAPGIDGPVTYDLTSTITQNSDGTVTASGTRNVNGSFVSAMRAGNVYFNVHTALNPGGEVRGQVNANDAFTAVFSSDAEIPAPVVTTGVRIIAQNRAPEGGTLQTPVWIGFHDGTFDFFDVGSLASADLERLAEDGNVDPLATAFENSAAGRQHVTLFGDAGAIAPGGSASAVIRVDALATGYVGYASMVIPSNDAFVGGDDPLGVQIFDAGGAFMEGVDFTIGGDVVLDAGTEDNDELAASTAGLMQMGPNIGTPTVPQDPVAIHMGLAALGMGGVLDQGFPNADFKAVGYETLRLSFKEVTDLPAPSGVASVVLNDTMDAIDYSLVVANLSGPATGAHLHMGAVGITGPIEISLTADITTNTGGTLEASGTGVAITPAQLTLLMAGELYFNVHTALNPSGEVRAQVQTP